MTTVPDGPGVDEPCRTEQVRPGPSGDAAADRLFLVPAPTVARVGPAGLPRDRVGDASTAKTLHREEEG
ncbi:hypothetical protein [Nocardiopsis chromatogenes]|uniref:hypothetical protein n=1 Tax=Nocardiopsis chromatogenes TaxID=280239 RepID=UPI0003472834|nr:hypothetical protein [Nocardiopsis chromatogenes]